MSIEAKTESIQDQLRALWSKHSKAIAFHSGEVKRISAALAALGQAVDTVVGMDEVVNGPPRAARRISADTAEAAKLIAEHVQKHGPTRVQQIVDMGLCSEPTVRKIFATLAFEKVPNTSTWKWREVVPGAGGQTLGEAAAAVKPEVKP